MLRSTSVLYCGPCGMPLEYCEYSPDCETHCNPWWQKNHPSLFAEFQALRGNAPAKDDNAADVKQPSRPSEPWTTEQRLTAFYEKYEPSKVESVPQLLEKYEGKEGKLFQALVKKYGPEPEDPYYMEDDGGEDDDDDNDEPDDQDDNDDKGKRKKRRGVGAKKESKVDTRVVIQKISRNRKKATTVVTGMDTVAGVKLKDVSKAFSKRFAGSSSVKDGFKGKEIIIQGDHMDDVAEMVVNKFGVAGDSVYLDIDGDFVPYQ